MAGKLLGLLEALTAAQALGFGAAGLVIFSQVGGAGLGGFAILFAGAVVLTAVFLALLPFSRSAAEAGAAPAQLPWPWSSGSWPWS